MQYQYNTDTNPATPPPPCLVIIVIIGIIIAPNAK